MDSVAAADELREIYAHALDGIEQALGITRSGVLLLDGEHVARFVAWRGLSDEYRKRAEKHFPWPVDAIDPPPIAVSDVMLEPSLAELQEQFRTEGIAALAFIPLVYNRRLIGKFMLYRTHA
ncbi:MAG: GAF domain-containing protein [Deltaproteobacteria bacterium]|nr:GAF domain-containing protein [Deltaproteobacteria bacterium]